MFEYPLLHLKERTVNHFAGLNAVISLLTGGLIPSPSKYAITNSLQSHIRIQARENQTELTLKASYFQLHPDP